MYNYGAKGEKMSVKDKLQIILITYNRAIHVENTFKQLLDESSPVKDFDITILDNNSNDDTSSMVKKWQENFPNLKYIKNRHNIGGNGNIAKAMEIANKDYLWTIGDDDLYDFSNWGEVEKAIEDNKKIICVADYDLNDNEREKLEYVIGQTTFITGLITNTSLFSDSVMRNVFDNIYTLFPHLIPVIDLINKGGKDEIYVLKKGIAQNGMNVETTDYSYIRGNKPDDLCKKTVKMSWILGFCEVMAFLKDEKLRERTVLTNAKEMHGSLKEFYKFIDVVYRYDLDLYFVIINSLRGFNKFRLSLKAIFRYFFYFERKIKLSEKEREVRLLCGLIRYRYIRNHS